MKTVLKNRILLLLILIVFQSKSIFAQDYPKVNESTSSSTILKKNVKLMVRLPDNYEASKKMYPVLYLLNGMDKTVEEIATLTQKLHDDKSTSEMIVVGIDISDENIDRMPDKAHSDKILSYFEGIEPQPGFNEGWQFVSKSETANKIKASPLTMTQKTNGKWVIMDSKKTTLYDVFIYDNGPDYASEGLIRVVKNGKIGYADAKTYTIVITPQYDCAFPFENGKAKVSNKCKTIKDGEHSIWASDAWQYVDKKGKF